ncbi:MAG: MazG-like family protein [Nanoarchaeota archaeon]|nr:MazG-like family protein [Nanoarchaeota archaeon]
MDFDELLEFISTEDKRLRNKYGNYSDEEKRVLVRLVKLGEEFGELSSEVLANNSFQRTEKLEKHSKESTEEEFADVMITTLLLAQAMDIDIKKALKDKIDKINKRYTSI